MDSHPPQPGGSHMKRMLAAACMALSSAVAFAQVVSTPSQSQGMALTVYNGGFAVVRETRSLELNKGLNKLRYEGVAQKIDPTSLSIKSLTAPLGLSVREQNYQYDLLNPVSILNKCVGQTIRLKQTSPTGATSILEGKLLNPPTAVIANTDSGRGGNTYQGLVLQTKDGLVLDPEGEITVTKLPDGLVSSPSLMWLLEIAKAGKQRAEVSYITEGITWKADYVAVVSNDEKKLDLTGWVTIDNRSGATYPTAKLQLMAGDVRRIQPAAPRNAGYTKLMMKGAMDSASAFTEQSFFEYHLYTLDGKTTVAQNETKQMNLLSAHNVTAQRRLIFDSAKSSMRPGQGGSTNAGKLAIMLEIKNDKASNMGMPLPKGKIRVYKADNSAALQFIGEDLIDHTPKDETVRCYVGDAFDVVGTRTQTNLKNVSDRVQEASYSINIRNRKDTAVNVTVVERFSNDWEILQKNHDFKKIDSRTAEFALNIPANKEATVNYTVRTKW